MQDNIIVETAVFHYTGLLLNAVKENFQFFMCPPPSKKRLFIALHLSVRRIAPCPINNYGLVRPSLFRPPTDIGHRK